MQYPLISEYLAAIRDAHDNLDKLSHLVPVLDNYGEPYRSSGAFAVVFKMKDEQTGKCYALKCFTEEQEGRLSLYEAHEHATHIETKLKQHFGADTHVGIHLEPIKVNGKYQKPE